MKVFTIKKDITYIHYTKKKDILKQERQINNIKQKCVDKVMKKAFAYLSKDLCSLKTGKDGIPKIDRARLDMWTTRTIWVLDDRFWCKRIVDDNTSVFEKVVSIGVLDNEEGYITNVKHMLHLEDDNQTKKLCDLLSKKEKRDEVIVK